METQDRWYKPIVERMLESLSGLQGLLEALEERRAESDSGMRGILADVEAELKKLSALDPSTISDEDLRANLSALAIKLSTLAHAFENALR